MTTPTPQRWTDQSRDALAELIRERLEDLGDEGRDAEGTPDGSLWLDGVEKVADDLAGVILAAGADAGLLVQPHTGPRVWAMPERIPASVNAVTDRHGRTFHRFGYEGRYWRQGPEHLGGAYEWHEADLVHARG